MQIPVKAQAGVSRDRAWIEREFGRERWSAVLGRVRDLQAGGETSLARAIAALNRDDCGDAGLDRGDIVLAGRRVGVPSVFAYPGFYALVRNVLAQRCEAIRPDLIVELGAGWGRNLFDLWLSGGPRDARYAALEFTASGRDATGLLGEFEAGLRLEVHPFDYYAPDLAAVTSGRRVLVFTVFSIDQIPTMSAAMIEATLHLGAEVWGVHFEPFGWQCRDELGRSDLVGSSPTYAARHDYNRNFWPVMRELEQRGVIAIERVDPELYGANPDNAASLLLWRKVQPE
jgi:hypothetical protein